jgi:hypothetical protein
LFGWRERDDRWGTRECAAAVIEESRRNDRSVWTNAS